MGKTSVSQVTFIHNFALISLNVRYSLSTILIPEPRLESELNEDSSKQISWLLNMKFWAGCISTESLFICLMANT